MPSRNIPKRFGIGSNKGIHMQSEFSAKECPRCGTTLRGNASHCPICQYNFIRGPEYIKEIPLEFALLMSLSSFFSFLSFFSLTFELINTFPVSLFLYSLNVMPIELLSESLLVPASLVMWKYFNSLSRDSSFQFSSESDAALLSAILICMAILFLILLSVFAGKSSNYYSFNNFYDQIIISIVKYLYLGFTFLFSVLVYGIYKIGKMESKNTYIIAAIFILCGTLIVRSLPLLWLFYPPSIIFFISNPVRVLIFYLISTGYILTGVFSLLILIRVK